jgi:hypothetical protein
VQSGARRDGIAGIYGNPGIVESVTYRIYKIDQSPNPTLSAIHPPTPKISHFLVLAEF